MSISLRAWALVAAPRICRDAFIQMHQHMCAWGFVVVVDVDDDFGHGGGGGEGGGGGGGEGGG